MLLLQKTRSEQGMCKMLKKLYLLNRSKKCVKLDVQRKFSFFDCKEDPLEVLADLEDEADALDSENLGLRESLLKSEQLKAKYQRRAEQSQSRVRRLQEELGRF